MSWGGVLRRLRSRRTSNHVKLDYGLVPQCSFSTTGTVLLLLVLNVVWLWNFNFSFQDLDLLTKGQLISKWLFVFFNSPKKRTKNFCPSRQGQKLTFSSLFFGRIEDFISRLTDLWYSNCKLLAIIIIKQQISYFKAFENKLFWKTQED